MKGASILIVEDNSLVARDIQGLLQTMGYRVDHVVASGERALDIVATDPPDIVLMDIKLKGKLNGIEAADMIREQYNLPVVFLTAYSDSKTLERAKVAQPFGFLLKPFNERELYSTIEISLYRRQMEKKLTESRQWLSSTLGSIDDAILTTDEQGLIVYMNPAAEGLLRLEQKDMLNKYLYDIVTVQHSITRQQLTPSFIGVSIVDLALLFPPVALLQRHNEHPIEVRVRMTKIATDKDHSLGYVCIISDLREQLRMAEELSTLRRAINQTADCIFITSPDGLINYINPAFLQMTGLTEHEIMLKTLLDLPVFDEKSHHQVSQIIAALSHGNQWSGSLFCRDVSGRKKEVWVNASPIRNQAQEIFEYVFVARDLTDRKRYESLVEAINITDNIGYIFSGIRHELGNPINTIKLILDQLSENMKRYSSEKIEEYVKIAAAEIHRVEDLFNSLRSYSLFEDIDCSSVSIAEFFQDFQRIIAADLKSRDISLTLTLPKNEVKLHIDTRAFHHVFINLITNAMDALENTREPAIEIKVDRVDQYILITVEDNGSGIPDEKINDIFKPFYTDKENGTGLGLVIVRKLLAKMNGTIDIKSRIRQGTTVILSLPDPVYHKIDCVHSDRDLLPSETMV